MFKRAFFWLLIIAAVVGAAAAIRLVATLRKPIPEAKLLTEPPKAPFPNSIGARGLIEAVDENVKIAPAVPGLVTEVKVAPGQQVKKGDVLVRQDSRDAEAMIAAQDAEITTLQTQLKEAEVVLAEKRDMWARIEKLSAGRVASEEETKRVQFATQTAEAQLASTKAKIASAEAHLSRMKVQLDLLTIRAPRDGRVLQVNTRAGEFADNKSQQPILLLGQTDHFQLRVDVDEDNATDVVLERAAKAYLKGRRDVEITLTPVRIEPYILPKKSLTGESSERVDTRVLQIIYTFQPPVGYPVYVGQQMDVFIEKAKRK